MKFIQDITFGQYVAGASFIHRLDPRAKLLSVFILLPLIFTANEILPLFSLALTVFIAAGLSRIPVSFILRGLKYFFWLFLFAALIHLIFTPGAPLPYLSSVSYEGVKEGARLIVQLMLAVVIGSLLTLTTTPLELAMGLEKLLSPFKKVGVPVSDLSMMMLVAVRFIPVLKLEAEGIVRAQKGRGIDLSSGGFIEKVKAIPVVLVPLIYNSFRVADDLAVAMVSRGYAPGRKRGCLRDMRFGMREYITLGLVIVLGTLVHYGSLAAK